MTWALVFVPRWVGAAARIVGFILGLAAACALGGVAGHIMRGVLQ